MKRTLVVLATATATALSAPLAATASAATADPVYFGEAASGTYQEQYDDHGSDVTTLSDSRIALRFYGSGWPNDEEGTGTYWFHTRYGSRFYMSKCDAQGQPLASPVRVARTTFLNRVQRTAERSVEFTYDAKRNIGTFTVYSGYPGTTPGQLESCRTG